MKQGANYHRPGENLQRKHHFFHIVDVASKQTRCTVDHFAEQIVDDQTGKQDIGEFGAAAARTLAPAHLENDAENKGIYRQHEYGIEQRPDQPEYGPAITPDDFALAHLQYQMPVVEQASKNTQGAADGKTIAGRENCHCRPRKTQATCAEIWSAFTFRRLFSST